MILAFTVEASSLSTAHRATALVINGAVRKVRSRGYDAWLRLCRVHAQQARGRARGWRTDAPGGYALLIVVHEKDARSRDLDNIAKPVLDACNGVLWSDDRHVHASAVVRGEPSKSTPRVEVVVMACDGNSLRERLGAVGGLVERERFLSGGGV